MTYNTEMYKYWIDTLTIMIYIKRMVSVKHAEPEWNVMIQFFLGTSTDRVLSKLKALKA